MKRLVILSSLVALLALSVTAASAAGVPAPTQQPRNGTSLVPRAQHANMVQIALGEWRACSATTAGAVLCWGANGAGQIGDGTTSASRPYPVYVQGLTGVNAIAVGGEHTCATIDGGVKCWGLNSYGQLGNNSMTNSSTPVDVQTSSSDPTPLSGVVAVAAGSLHTCALLATGGVKCWGLNSTGQLGDGTITRSLTPVDVRTSSTDTTPLSMVTAITSGTSHTCALMSSGGVKCWGANANGQLGDGTSGNAKTSPVDVRAGSGNSNPLSGATALDAGDNFTCVVMASGGAKCWGQGGNGQLGNISATNVTNSPMDVQTSSTNSSPLPGVISVAGGGYHTCALMSTGGVKCWGNNPYGQLGDGTVTQSKTPVDVAGLGGVIAVDTGHYSSCALLSTGEVQCWGYNAHGELGTGGTDLVAHSAPLSVEFPILTTAAVASSTNPAVIGQTIVFTATVSTGDPLKVPTGNVAFFDGATSLGTGTLNASAQVTRSVTAAGAGAHSITAVYAGGIGFEASSSAAYSQNVNKASTLTALGVPPDGRWLEPTVLFTATVTIVAPGTGSPTGTVTFRDGLNTIAGCGTQALSSTRTATCTSGALSTGSHAITANYSGDETSAQSTSAALNLNVARAYIPLTIAP